MDRRLTPTNGRVAEIGWEDRVSADRFVKGDWQTVRSSFVDLCREPGGARDRQLLHGDRFLTLETLDGWSFGRSGKDGYVGYISAAALGSDIAPTHVVTARATHFYADPSIKSRNVMALGFGSKLSLVDEIDAFFATSDGLFVPKVHVGGIEQAPTDPVSVAEVFLGTPYLWGGNTVFGIDCSGLVQAALLACGIGCPGDSDMQAGLGTDLVETEESRRGDLVFWHGHVAIVVDDQRFIHANAHHMAVAFETIDDAIARIAAQGDGQITARRRLRAI